MGSNRKGSRLRIPGRKDWLSKGFFILAGVGFLTLSLGSVFAETKDGIGQQNSRSCEHINSSRDKPLSLGSESGGATAPTKSSGKSSRANTGK